MKNSLGTFAAITFFALSSLAQAAPTQITQNDCDQLAVRMGNYADAESLFLALPERSEFYGDSAMERSLELQTQHDHLRITCALSSGQRGLCSLVYRQNSATTDTCSRLPEVYFLSSEMSQKLSGTLRLKGGFFTTLDRVLEVSCRTPSVAETECKLDISR